MFSEEGGPAAEAKETVACCQSANLRVREIVTL